MNFAQTKRSHWARLTVGWCVLLLYAAACSPLGLGLAALAGSADHQLLVGRGERGVRLVLHHGSRCAAHHHGFAAHALTLFAQPANAANPDHILQFSSADTLKSRSQSPGPQPDLRSVLVVLQGGASLVHTPKLFASGISLPDAHAVPLCRRSTILLI